MRCPSVCLSHSYILSKRINIFPKFLPLCSHTILIFPHQTLWWYEAIECRWGRQKSGFWANIWLHRVLSMLRPTRCYQHGAAGPWKFVTLTAGSKRWSLLMARDDDEMFMTRSLNVTPKAIEQHLIVHSDKSVAYVTNNQRLLGGFCSIEANYWQIRSIVQPLCDSRATWEHLRCCTRTRMEAGIRATPILRDKPRHCRLSSFSFKSMDEWTKAAASDRRYRPLLTKCEDRCVRRVQGHPRSPPSFEGEHLATRLCSDSANLRQGQNLDQKWSGIPIWIFGLTWIQNFRSGCLPERSKNVVDSLFFSASVISPSVVKISQWLYQKC